MADTGIARITLLADPGKTVTLRYGTDSRIPLDQFGTDADFDDPAKCAAMGTNPYDERNKRGRLNYGVAVEFTLSWADKAMRSVDVPVGCAMLYFGDWRIAPGNRRSAMQLTFNQEKARVAVRWGGYKYPRMSRKVDNPSETDMRIIGVPPMPAVKIEMLDQRTHSPIKPEIFPSQLWNFHSDIDEIAKAEVARAHEAAGLVTGERPASFDVSKLSADDIANLKKALAVK